MSSTYNASTLQLVNSGGAANTMMFPTTRRFSAPTTDAVVMADMDK
jgi:hypothetical protein